LALVSGEQYKLLSMEINHMALKYTKLTRASVRQLARKQSISEHGITFERLVNGDGRYKVNIMVDGQRIHRVIGKESEGVTRQQAEDFIEQLKTEARQQRLHLPEGRKLTLNFDTAGKQYLDRLQQENGNNISRKQQQFTDYLIPFFKEAPLAMLTSSDIERYKKKRIEQDHISGGSINRELATISHLLSKAVEWGWIKYKPCQIKKFKENRNRITYLTLEQMKRLLIAAKQDQNPHIYPFIRVGLETSMRRSEILNIQLKHIDLERQLIDIPQAKAGAREQPITKRLAQFLQERLQQATHQQIWLFPSASSETGHVINIDKAFRRAVIAAGLDPKQVVRHTLRHTAITHLVQAGVDLPTVQRISGHKTLQMVVRYSHQNGEHIQSAMDTLEQRYQFEE